MRIVGKKRIDKFIKSHANSRSSLRGWMAIAESVQWQTPQDIKNEFASASFLSNNRVIFNIGGNKFRLIVIAIYVQKTLIVTWVGTHAEYDKRNL